MADVIDSRTVRALAMGAAVLSAGGGSFPYLEYLGAVELLGETSNVPLIPVADLADDAHVAGVAMVGAPLPMFERFVDADHFTRPVRLLEQQLGITFDAVMGYEIGSMNGVIPAMVAAKMNLPLVDADTVGRSFPEVQMSGFAIAGIDMAPIAVSDIRANDLVIYRVASPRWLEELLRVLATACGSIIATCGINTGLQIKQHAYHGTYSKAMRIGAAILAAQTDHRDPIAALLASEGGALIAAGKIVDLDRQVSGGFVRGRARIANAPHGDVFVSFQNEYTLVERHTERCAMVPDLIAVFDSDRGEPLGTEALRYGQQVSVVRFPALPQHLSAHGLTVVGPRAFGYDFDYQQPSNEVDA